jgi:integrase
MPKAGKNANKTKLETTTGSHSYGDGLYLLVRGPRAASWFYRYSVDVDGKQVRREMGLGPAFGLGAVTTRKARTLLAPLREAVRDGRDPISERKQAKAARITKAEQAKTFKEAVDAFLAHHGTRWRSEKHTEQFEQTLKVYAYPTLGKLPVSIIDKKLVLKVLRPIWTTKQETASRVRGRIERVLDFAKSNDWREGENPAMWKGGLSGLLTAHEKRDRHLAALPYADLPQFWIELGLREGISVRALQFTILTAARSGETAGAKWSEIDLKAGLWTVPGTRMKSGRPHVVPLSRAALAILSDMLPFQREGDYVFVGDWEGAGLSDAAMASVLRRMRRRDFTIHGFRSSFRDWCGDETDFAREVAEAALAHAIGDATEAAYRRGSALEKRRALMEQWAKFVTTPPVDNVVQLVERAAD